MVIPHIIGGLGNQMFQYAAARALALRHGAALALETADFSGYALHQGFELDRVFTLDCPIATDADERRVLGWRYPQRVRRMLRRWPHLQLGQQRLAIEPHFQYWPGVRRLAPDCYMTGYWQSERYFLDVEAQIRADFAFRQVPGGLNAELAHAIGGVTAVSLHVRRGDYASNPATTAAHGLSSLDYYAAALRHVEEHVPGAHLFIFSDDIAWVRAHMTLNLPHTFVEHNTGAESYNDMRLMSLCRHHIIANSSFSWWGAWLNNRAGKIVVAPRAWFARPVDTSDLIPPQWVRL